MTIIEELRRDPEGGAKWLESEYKVGLLTIARRLCADSSDAEELVNRTFAAVVDGIDGFLEQSSFFTWMCQILVNIHAKDIRRKADGIVTCPGDVPDVPDESARDRIFRDVDGALLRDAIEALPPDLKRPVVLHYFMEISVRDAARLLSIPAGTFAWRLHCARDILAAKLGATARKPGGKALLIALALAALTAVGAAVWTAAAGARNAFDGNRELPAAGSQRQSAADGDLSTFRLSTFDDASDGTPEALQTTGDNMNLKSTSAALLAAATVATTAAIPSLADIYVAKTGSDANPGTSAEPKLTIQAGVDAVASGGTVHVAPGVYDDFTTDATHGRACVFITNKVVTLIASGAKAETVILGRRQPGVASGLGNDAVRCVVTSGAGGTVVSGFTLRNGCTKANARGGGYYDAGAKTDVTIADCDFQGCAANWAGGAYGGTSVGCLFTGCMATGYGSVLASAKAYNCVLVGNRIVSGCQGIVLYNAGMANCTIAFNEGWPVEQPRQNIYNCLMVGNTGWKASDKIVNCATDANVGTAVTTDDLFSPATGDWRLKTGSAAIGAGVAGNLPADYRDYDFNGNARLTGESINIGAVEASATPVDSGLTFVSCHPQYGFLSVDGAVSGSSVPLPLRVAALPAEPTVSFAAAEGYGMVALTNSTGNADIHWPLMDETVPLRIVSPVNLAYGPLPGPVIHVATDGNDSTGDGTAANPFATIKKAADVSGTHLVHVHAGDYAPDAVSQWGQSRIAVTKSVPVRIKAVDGPSATAIVGASDPTGDQGLGASAVRCAILDGPVALQGFTLRGGRTAEPAASSSLSKEGGGVMLRNNLASVLDCVFDDCIGSIGSAICTVNSDVGLGHVLRCVIRNCSVANVVDYNDGIAFGADLHACLFYGNTLPSGARQSAVIGFNCEARFCTVVETSASFGAFLSTHAQSWNSIVHGTTGGGFDLPWLEGYGSSYNFDYGLFGTGAKGAENYATAVQGRPKFSNPTAHDYRLRDNSPALAVGSLAYVTDRDLVDVAGTKYAFAASASGPCIAGCYATTVRSDTATILTIR